jgi:AraC-like DNA-binding protein
MKFHFDHRLSESSLVEFIWSTQTEGSGEFMSQAASNWEIVITQQLGRTYFTVRGPETKASPAPAPEEAEFLGIVFKLGTFMPNMPVRNLVDSAINLPDATGRSFWLHGEAWEAPTFENADVFITRLIRQGLLVNDPIVPAILQDQPQELSARAIQRRFVQATGLTYASIRQIERARQAMNLLQQGTSILDTVEQLGYFDQSHLTNSLKRFVGFTPSQIIRQLDTEQR